MFIYYTPVPDINSIADVLFATLKDETDAINSNLELALEDIYNMPVLRGKDTLCCGANEK